MSTSRFRLLTSSFIDGREAERIGLVSKCTPDEELMPTALRIAEDLAAGPRRAIAANGFPRNSPLDPVVGCLRRIDAGLF